MNGIVTGKIEKTAGSMVFHSKESLDLSQEVSSFSTWNKGEFIRIIDQRGILSIIGTDAINNVFPNVRDATCIVVNPASTDGYSRTLTLYIYDNILTIRLGINQAMNIYIKSIERGTLEIA